LADDETNITRRIICLEALEEGLLVSCWQEYAQAEVWRASNGQNPGGAGLGTRTIY